VTQWGADQRRERLKQRRAKGRDRRKALEVVRAAVVIRAKRCCERCGIPVSPKRPRWHPQRQHLNHKVPRSLGGDDSVENCELLCQACHLPGGQHAPTKERMDALKRTEEL
jgi:5-methylcytosine-specific restriction endonuclease McrA